MRKAGIAGRGLSRYLIGGVGLAALTCLAAPRSDLAKPVLEKGSEFSSWSAVYNRLFDADVAADEAWRAVDGAGEYDAKRRALRQRMIELVGGFPERTPLNAQVTGRLERNGYTVEKVLFESRPGAFVTALMYLPDAAKFPPPHHAAIELCGHSPLGKNNPAYRRVAVLAAKAGVATLVVDPFAQGERGQCPEDLDGRATTAHLRLGVNAMLLGHGLAAFMMWDAIRALDYLDSRPDVRHGRYGCMGNSGGGTQSVYLSGLDDRVAATATSCYLSNFREQTAWRLLADSEQLVFAQLKHGLNHAGYPLMGGRPVLMLARREDMIPYSGTRETFRLLHEIAVNIGAPGRYSFFDQPGPHGYNERSMRESAAFLVKHLRDAEIAFDDADVDNGPDGAEGWVSATGRVMDRPGFKSVYDYLREELDAALARRKPLAVGERAELVRRLADIDERRTGERRVLSERKLDGGKALSCRYESEGGCFLPCIELVPDAVRGEPVLLTADGPRTNRAGRAEALFAAGHPVLVADVTATGEIGKSKHYYCNPHDDEEIAKMLYLLGSSLVGRRAGDIIAIGRDARMRYGAKPKLIAQGRTAVAAAHANAADPDLFVAVGTVDAPLSWAESVRTRAFFDYAAAVHGGLLHYDWTDLLDGFTAKGIVVGEP